MGQVENKQLVAKQLDDNTLDHEQWLTNLRKMLVASQEGLAAIVAGEHCLVFDRQWRYYRLPRKAISWAMGDDSKYLWLIDEEYELSALELSSGQWMSFGNDLLYARLAHAEGDIAAASSLDMEAIDVLKLTSDGSIVRVASYAIEPIAQLDNIPGVQRRILSCGFVPERERFFVLKRYTQPGNAPYENYVLKSVSIDDKTEVVLEIEGRNALLCPPFIVVLYGAGDTLVYADLRKDPVEPKQQSLHFDHKLDLSWEIGNAFALGDNLIVALRTQQMNRQMLLQLGQEPEVLYEADGTSSVYRMFGPFFVCDSLVLDCINRKKKGRKLSSALLRQAIQDEMERRQRMPRVRLLHTMLQNTVSYDTNRLQIALHASHLSSEGLVALIEKASDSDFVSSTRGEMVFSDSNLVHLVTRNNKQFKLSLAMQQGRSRWKKFTFDEQGRVWVCDKKGFHIAVISPKKQEAQVFVLNDDRSISDKLADKLGEVIRGIAKVAYGDNWVDNLYVTHIAAYADTIVTVLRFKQNTHYSIPLLAFSLLSFYRYDDGKSLEEIACIQYPGAVVVKPDLEGKGWWLLQRGHLDTLSFLEMKTMNQAIVMNFPGHFVAVPELFGDWPEEVYFAYLDKDESGNYSLCYTLDPRNGWCRAPLQDIFRMYKQKYLFPSIVSIHSLGDSVFALLSVHTLNSDESPEAWLLTCLQSDHAELVAAFAKDKSKYFADDDEYRSKIDLARWRDMLVLRKEQPIVPSSWYASIAMINELPDNKGILFYHPDTKCFSTKPIVLYSVTEAFSKIVTRGSFDRLKPLL